MAFDFLAWGYGFILTQLSGRLLKGLASSELSERLRKEATEWATALPSEIATNYEHIFGEATAEPDAESRPARFRLQDRLQTAGVIPSEAEWLDAFLEHWEVKRTELRDQGNSFFRLDKEDARRCLANLAQRVHRCCQADPELARRTITKQLSEVLRRQEEDQRARQEEALLPYYARDLTLEAREFFLHRPEAWEYRLFSAVLSSELDRHASLLRDYRAGLSWGRRLAFADASELLRWLGSHFREAQGFGHNICALINEQLPVAFGAPGEPGDPEAIIDVARKVGEVHRSAIEWALSLRRVSAGDQFHATLRLCERFVEDEIRQIGNFSRELEESLQKCVSEGFSTPRTIRLTLTLTVPDGLVEELQREMDRLALEFGA